MKFSKIYQLHQLRTWELLHSIRMLVGISLSNLFEFWRCCQGFFVNKNLIKPMGGATCQGTTVFGIIMFSLWSWFYFFTRFRGKLWNTTYQGPLSLIRWGFCSHIQTNLIWLREKTQKHEWHQQTVMNHWNTISLHANVFFNDFWSKFVWAF